MNGVKRFSISGVRSVMHTWRNAVEVRPQLRKIVNNILWLLADKALSIFNSLIVGAVVARHLGAGVIGQIAKGQAIAAIVFPLLVLGMDKILVRNLVRNEATAAIDLRTAWILRIWIYVAAIIVSSPLLYYSYYCGGLPAFEAWIILFFMLAMVRIPFDLHRLVLEARVESKYAIWIDRSIQFVAALLQIIFVFLKAPLLCFVVTLAFSRVFSSAAIFAFVKRRCYVPVAGSFSLQRAGVLLRESWPLLLHGVAAVFFLRMDILMIEAFRGDAAAGKYEVAVRFTGLFYFIPLALGNSVLPTLIRNYRSQADVFHSRLFAYFRFNAALAYIVTVFGLLVFPGLIPFLFGSEFNQSGIISRIHIISLLFTFSGTGRAQYLIATDKVFYTFLCTGTGAVLNFALNWYLIPIYGGSGAAVATLITHLVSSVLMSFAFAELRGVGMIQIKAMLTPWKIGKQFFGNSVSMEQSPNSK
jgi:O-antigen/teichoic acid export membrane protein